MCRRPIPISVVDDQHKLAIRGNEGISCEIYLHKFKLLLLLLLLSSFKFTFTSLLLESFFASFILIIIIIVLWSLSSLSLS